MTQASVSTARGLYRAMLLAFLIAAAMATGGWPAYADIKFPPLSGRIVDDAMLLSTEDRADIESELAALESQSSDQLVVVTVTSLQDYEIEDFGYQLGRAWGIGRAGKDNGVLLIVAPKERKVRIEVGRGLEPLLTDLMSRIIIENAILPEFRGGNFSAGIRAGVRDIKATLLGDAEGVKERARGRDALEADWVGLLIVLFFMSIVIYTIWAEYRYMQQAATNPSLRRRGRRGVVIVPGGGSGTWGSGGWSSGGGGGGWSGGGGDFGGGGSSGSW